MPPFQHDLAILARVAALVAMTVGGFAPLARAAESAKAAADIAPAAAGIDQLIHGLSSDDFSVREQALRTLQARSHDPQHGAALARSARAALGRIDLSYEARRRLERLLQQLPPATAPSPRVSDEELDRLVASLDGGTYADRVGAAARLAALVEEPAGACRAIVRLRPLRRSPVLSRQTRERIEPLWERAQLVWLTSDPATWQWPPVSKDDIEHWLDQLTRPVPPAADNALLEESRARLERRRRLTGRDVAREELLALLVRDDQTAQVKAAIDARLAADMDEDARKLLAELAEWGRPWLALEGWHDHKVASLLELPVGMPYTVPMSPRPTLFDSVDETNAHCVSDAALRPGDYPVGVFFPHPSPLRGDSQFILFHLPMPRRRLAYHYQLKLNRDGRLAELSQRTLARLAAEKRPLKQAEFIMLASLDAHAVSRFAGKYLVELGDPSPPDKQREDKAGRGSPHTSLCNLLVEIGTHEAVPGLLEAIRSGKIKPAVTADSADWPWFAVLTILANDPGPDADRILSGLLGRSDPLAAGRQARCDLGATAAAILLALHEQPLEKFGLELVEAPLLAEYGAIGYRFNPPEMRGRVIAWWNARPARNPEAAPQGTPR
jgi:hypothetical protein